jgi:hypothetical protein
MNGRWNKRVVLIVLVALALSGCDFLVSPTGITQVVVASGVKGDALEPVNASDNIAPDQNEIHAVVTLTSAPKDSLVKAVWMAVDLGSALPPNAKLDEKEIKVEGSCNVDFVLVRAGKAWSPGLYKVELYWNGKLDRTVNFVITGTPLRTGVAMLGACPPATTQPHKVTGWITQVILAENVQGEEKEPVNRTGEFLRNETIHAVVTIKDAPPNTKLRAVFFAVDAGESTVCNTRLGESEFIAEGARYLDFALKPGADWQLGKYRVDIYVNDALDHTANYVVVMQKSVH